MEEVKRCSKCKEVKSVGEFSKHHSVADGLQKYCKTCNRAYVIANRAKIVSQAAIRAKKFKTNGPTIQRTEKRCPTCKEVKPAGEFRLNRSNVDWLGSQCKTCLKPVGTSYYAANRDTLKVANRARYAAAPEKHRDRELKKKYGVSLAQYDKELKRQGGGCEICGKTPEQNGKSLAVDHDHACCPGDITCGKCLRGLLCSQCNNFLGHAQDSVKFLESMISYLNSHSARLTKHKSQTIQRGRNDGRRVERT